jgi:glycerol-3-phosphate dehydrogenase
VPNPVIRPTKGVHITYRRENVGNKMATIIKSITDGRAFFVLPRGEFTVIGTTDTDYEDDLASPFCNKEDADYLITSVKHYFPKAQLDYKNIISTWAGIRPLVMQKGKSESDISRKHLIFFSDDNLLTITGGKLTTFRKMAEDLFVEVEKKGIFQNIGREEGFSKQKYLISYEKRKWEEDVKKSGILIDDKIMNLLYQQYGRGSKEILKIIEKDESFKERIINENDFIKAEILYILRNELTPHLIDIFCRRTEMSLFIHHEKQEQAAKIVADIMASEYSWNQEKKKDEISNYLDYIKKTVSFI